MKSLSFHETRGHQENLFWWLEMELTTNFSLLVGIWQLHLSSLSNQGLKYNKNETYVQNLSF